MTVTELLRLAPFSLGTITILLAAGGLLFGHAYGRYGDDAAMGFLMRARFALAAALVLPIPVLMLVSFGAGKVPSWLTEARAAALVGLGLATTAVMVGYLLITVGRPSTFLASVGRRVRVRRVNRYARSRHWRDPEEFAADLGMRQYRWLKPVWDFPGHAERMRAGHEHAVVVETQARRDIRVLGSAGRLALTGWMHARRMAVSGWRHAGHLAVTGWMHGRRLGLRAYRTDASEMLF